MLLVLVTMLCCAPAVSTTTVEEENANSEQSTTQPAEIHEVVGLREENVKHFDLGNGTFQAVAFGGPVHTLDADGL